MNSTPWDREYDAVNRQRANAVTISKRQRDAIEHALVVLRASKPYVVEDSGDLLLDIADAITHLEETLKD